MKLKHLILLLLAAFGCQTENKETTGQTAEPVAETTPFVWENANVYFLLTDRFYNGDTTNDQAFDRQADGAVLRSFTGGDLKGITQKIQEGYFNDLGITAIWFTPPVEQVHGHTDEGTGKTYAYHGYWARDWTNIDPNFGSHEDLKELVQVAHDNGIRILMDAVINHTGPVTETDSQWPDEWVRTSPVCSFQDAQTTIECTLVENLPDIRTEKDKEVELPPFLVEKWKAEGRYEQEIKELDEFFARTGYPRAPRFYIIKWLTDYVREYGIDGFRVDTAKHTEASVWEDLKVEALLALREWKEQNPAEKLDDLDFFMTGEVYGYSLYGGKQFDMGNGEMVNFYDNGFENLINFSFKYDAQKPAAQLFEEYAGILHSDSMRDVSVLNYLSSHDDGDPYDRDRDKVFEAGTKLLLAPGASQLYYGDELARPLTAEGANGDANLRTFMNWNELEANASKNGYQVAEVLAHWQKLGQFRREHVAVGAGQHTKLQESPFVFKREYSQNGLEDKVMVAMDLPENQPVELDVHGTFADGTTLKDHYSGATATVENGQVKFSSPASLLLLAEAPAAM